MYKGGWFWIDNEWYGFWWDGKMCTGWVWDTDWSAWYYCFNNGVCAKDTWVEDGSSWYYMNNSCHKLTNTWVGDYWLNEHGMWV